MASKEWHSQEVNKTQTSNLPHLNHTTMKTTLCILLSAFALYSCTPITQPATVPTITGQWSTPDNEYRLTVATTDSAYMFEEFNGYGAPDSSMSVSADSLFASFVFPGTTAHYRLRIYADSLTGTVAFGSNGPLPTALFKVK
jgi:hypothetical protein